MKSHEYSDKRRCWSSTVPSYSSQPSLRLPRQCLGKLQGPSLDGKLGCLQRRWEHATISAEPGHRERAKSGVWQCCAKDYIEGHENLGAGQRAAASVKNPFNFPTPPPLKQSIYFIDQSNSKNRKHSNNPPLSNDPTLPLPISLTSGRRQSRKIVTLYSSRRGGSILLALLLHQTQLHCKLQIANLACLARAR